MFSTWSGKPISPNNVVRRWIIPACATLGLERVTWLTLRRTYSSWAHEKGVPGKVIAQLTGHAKVDTTLNVYTQVVDGSLRKAADVVGSELFTIVHKPEKGDGEALVGARARLAEALRWFEAASGPPTRLTSLRRDSLRTRSQAKAGSSGWTRTCSRRAEWRAAV